MNKLLLPIFIAIAALGYFSFSSLAQARVLTDSGNSSCRPTIRPGVCNWATHQLCSQITYCSGNKSLIYCGYFNNTCGYKKPVAPKPTPKPAPKNPKLQAKGCVTKVLNYSYIDDIPYSYRSGKLISGSLSVGICANEHIRRGTTNEGVAQVNVFISQTGAPIRCANPASLSTNPVIYDGGRFYLEELSQGNRHDTPVTYDSGALVKNLGCATGQDYGFAIDNNGIYNVSTGGNITYGNIGDKIDGWFGADVYSAGAKSVYLGSLQFAGPTITLK